MGVYAIVQDLNVPLILQPQLFGALCLLSWAQCQFYGARRPLHVCVALYVGCLCVLAGFQVGVVYAVRVSAAAPVVTGCEDLHGRSRRTNGEMGEPWRRLGSCRR